MPEDTPAAPQSPLNLNALMQQNPVLFFLLLIVLGGQGYDIMGGQNSKLEIQQLTAQVTQLVVEVRSMSSRVERGEDRTDDQEEDIQDLTERVRDLEDALDRMEP